MSQLMLPSCSAARVPDCRSYWRNTAPWSITAQAPSAAWYACRRAASGSHAVPELIRASETPAAPATGAGAPRATESAGAPCSCCPRTGTGTAGEPAIAGRTTDRLMNEGVEGAEGPGGRVRQEEQRNVQLPALPGAGRRRDVTSERLSRHPDGRRERRWSERKVGCHVAGDARDLASVGRVQPNFDAVCHFADEGDVAGDVQILVKQPNRCQAVRGRRGGRRTGEDTPEIPSPFYILCRLFFFKKKNKKTAMIT